MILQLNWVQNYGNISVIAIWKPCILDIKKERTESALDFGLK